jgi:hypothetical protein
LHSKDLIPEDPSHKVYAILVNSKWEAGGDITDDEAEPEEVPIPLPPAEAEAPSETIRCGPKTNINDKKKYANFF